MICNNNTERSDMTRLSTLYIYSFHPPPHPTLRLTMSGRRRRDRIKEGIKETNDSETDRWTCLWCRHRAQHCWDICAHDETRCSSFQLGCVTNSLVKTTVRRWSGNHRQYFQHYRLLQFVFGAFFQSCSILSSCNFLSVGFLCFDQTLKSHWDVSSDCG